MKILTAEQMRRIDRRTIRKMHVPALVLMENAGIRTYDVLVESYPDLDEKRILILCGGGNNGGDGLVIARHLAGRGVIPRIVLIVRKQELRGEALANLRAAEGIGLSVEEALAPAAWNRIAGRLEDYDLIVDALLGTGLRGAARGLAARVIEAVNDSSVPVLSVDIPSGLSGDSAAVPGPVVRAERTVTFCRPKIPHIFPPAESLVGDLTVVDIGIPDSAVEAEDVPLDLVEREMLVELLVPRHDDSHKGDFGHVLIVAGSRDRSGAAALAARGALRGGCGLVTVATAIAAQPLLSPQLSEMMTFALPQTTAGNVAERALDPALELASGLDVLAVGPGLGREESTRSFVRAFVGRTRQPLVLDADGLNAFTGTAGELSGRDRTLVLTPHSGEMARLAGSTTGDVMADRIGVSRAFAKDHRCFLVLKGYRTLVATPHGGVFVNPTGNPGMATAGSGDVLTGLIASLLGQKHHPLAACLLAAWLHGRAGDLAAARLGEEPLMAGDLLTCYPEALRELREGGA
ncbi:MAG: bifunctional ADP-dependent NAD(P)H-hydrate dehydratase/NAD(P)H-hydrate epimerase [Acidobacteria bacterium]|nr:MAG: bifunctional ADP-dependent NAD(P)H-hydrate dehydratase/NAD(P)H-hydrate epimerase [Acidobacteriota bacterium]